MVYVDLCNGKIIGLCMGEKRIGFEGKISNDFNKNLLPQLPWGTVCVLCGSPADLRGSREVLFPTVSLYTYPIMMWDSLSR